MTQEFYIFTLSIAGSIILLCFAVIGFFLSRLISDVKQNTENIGKNKGNIEILTKQQENDLKLFNEVTQLKFQRVTDDLALLTEQISKLTDILIKSNTKNG